MHLNIRSLLGKLDSLKSFIIENNCDILAVSETWLDSDISSHAVSIDGYNFLRRDRGSRGGGVAFYISKKFKYEIINTPNTIEQLWATVHVNSMNKIACGVVYRPPNYNCAKFLDELEGSISSCLPQSDDIFCLGDLNIDVSKPDTHSADLLFALINDLQLTQLINDPTRITENSSTIIDLILTNNIDRVLLSGVENCTFSDHDGVFTTLSFSKPKPIFRYCRIFKNVDLDSLCLELKSKNLDTIFYIKNIEEKLKFLNGAILSVFNAFAPIRLVKFTKPPAPWLTHNIRLLMTLRDNAKKKHKQTKLPAHWEYYKTLRNYTTQAIRNEKKAYFSHVCQNNNSKQLWKELKRLNISNNNNSKIEIPDNLNDPNELNKFFIESVPKVSKDNSNLINFYNSNVIGTVEADSFNFDLVNHEKILSSLNKINTNSMGADEINLHMLKICYPVIKNHLLHIINCCLLENYFPAKWKIAHVIPLPKSAKVEQYKDLRPISLLPTLSKILESIMSQQIKQYLKNNNLMPPHQSGFRARHSCTTALLKITDDIIQATDENKLTVLVLLDYSKAFDCVNYNILLSMLHFHGFSSNAVKLLETYLIGRTQMVKRNDTLSSSLELSRGVPQGSILGPLLFCLYTATLNRHISHCRIHTYADDTQVYLSFDPKDLIASVHNINSDLQSIYNVSLEHELILNANKTKVLLFGTNATCQKYQNMININLNGVDVDYSSEARNLGLIMDNNFRYKKHVSNCIQKAYGNLRVLYPHRAYLNINTKTKLCETLVLSQFNFCGPIYSPCLDSVDSYRIQKVQNSCLRYIFGIRKYEHISHKLKDLKWLNMRNRFLLQSLSLFHSIITFKEPQYLYEKISFRTDIHNINIRYPNSITAPFHKTALFERSYNFIMYKVYNKVPEQYKRLQLSAFKKFTRQWLYNEQLSNF